MKESTQQQRVVVFQPALPNYRLDFFDRVARRLGEGFAVLYSPTDMGALTASSVRRAWAKALSPMRQLFPGLDWQPGVMTVALRRGDVIVISGSPRNLSNMLMLVWARLRGIRTVWWGQYWSNSSKLPSFIIRMLLMRFASAVLFYTDREVEEYRSSHGKRDPRIVTALNNGINLDPIVALREPYEVSRRDKAILFISRLTEKADLSTLLRALCDPRLQDVRLDVVGDGEERQALEALAKELMLEDRIVWHGGISEEQAIARVVNVCRLFVYPGAVGLSLLHAMAYGLPVVVHDERWAQGPEIAAFYRAGNGLSFPRGNSEGLANALVQALERIESDRSWSDASIQTAETEFNTERMADRFCELMSHLKNGDTRHAS